MLKVNLNGTILDNEECEIMRWFGWTDVVCPKDIEDTLAESPEEEATLYINSPGGNMIAGSLIRSILKAHKGHTSAVIQSHAASAATICMTGCDEVIAEPVALICVHNPSANAEGTAEDLRGTAKDLDTAKESIINAYMSRSKVTREQLSELMDEDRWISPQEAFELGLIDKINEGETLNGPVVITNACGAATIRPSQQMREEYQNHKEKEIKARRTKAKFAVLAK